MHRDDVIARLRAHQPELQSLGVRRLYVFGSVGRDAARSGSDIDVMVDLDEGASGRKALFSAFDVGAIQYALSQWLERPVDLVVRADALKLGRNLQDAARDELVSVF